MRPLPSLFLTASLMTIGCGSKETQPQPSQESSPSASAESESTQAAAPEAEEIHVRALFYYERAGANGVTPYPASAEHSPRGEGEKAWLEVHTNGAAHAYAFAVFSDGNIEALWSEAIKKKKHTPPMNAFENGLSLSEQFDADSTLLVVASLSPLEGLDEISNCNTNPTAGCSEVVQILEKHTPEAPPTSALRMRHMETETPAFGSMNSGSGISAVAFSVKGR